MYTRGELLSIPARFRRTNVDLWPQANDVTDMDLGEHSDSLQLMRGLAPAVAFHRIQSTIWVCKKRSVSDHVRIIYMCHSWQAIDYWVDIIRFYYLHLPKYLYPHNLYNCIIQKYNASYNLPPSRCITHIFRILYTMLSYMNFLTNKLNPHILILYRVLWIHLSHFLTEK